MEQIKKEERVKLRMPLQKAFFRYVMTTFMLVVVLSAAVILVSIRVQRWLLPDKDAVYLHVEEKMNDGTTTSCVHLMELNGDFMEAAILAAEEDGKPVKPDIVSTRYALESYDNAVAFLTPKKSCSILAVMVRWRCCRRCFPSLAFCFAAGGFFKRS